ERSDPGRGVLQLDLVAVERRRDALWVYRHRDAAVHLDPGATADLDRGGRIAGRERLRHGLVAGVAVVDAERLERLEEALLRFAQRHPALRPPRPLPASPVARSVPVTATARSVAVSPSAGVPVSLTPTTCGIGIEIGSPSIAASASIPPTPQPSTPSPFTIVVCESVPTSVSGNVLPSRVSTTRARNSRFTWWTIPVFGGTTLKLSNASWPQRRNAYRSRFR